MKLLILLQMHEAIHAAFAQELDGHVSGLWLFCEAGDTASNANSFSRHNQSHPCPCQGLPKPFASVTALYQAFGRSAQLLTLPHEAIHVATAQGLDGHVPVAIT